MRCPDVRDLGVTDIRNYFGGSPKSPVAKTVISYTDLIGALAHLHQNGQIEYPHNNVSPNNKR